MRPAREGREHRTTVVATGVLYVASMRPAREGREHARPELRRPGAAGASMRPAREGREHARLAAEVVRKRLLQ